MITRRETGGLTDGSGYIEKIEVRRRWRSVDRFVVIGWVLILIKCVLASVAIEHWSIPIVHFYVWGPSIIFGGLCTGLWLSREES